jgi:cytidine deaminase
VFTGTGRPSPPGYRAPVGVDWQQLRAAAVAVSRQAYAPYSGFPVGAAGWTDDGRVVVGCNVENASYGLTLCAECGVVSALHAAGGDSLLAVSVVAGDGQPILPCGRCRQLLLEAGGPDLPIDGGDGPRPLRELLPDGFTPGDLRERRQA